MSKFFKFDNNKQCKPTVNENFELNDGKGFLPRFYFIQHSGNLEFQKLLKLSEQLPKLIQERKVVSTIDENFSIDIGSLIGDYSDPSLMLQSYSILSLISHAYEVEKGKTLANHSSDNNIPSPVIITQKLAEAFFTLSSSLCRVPTQTYETYVLQNYKLMDATKGYSVGNIEPIVTYTNSSSEKHFIKVHVMTEFYGGLAIQALINAEQNITSNSNNEEILKYLNVANENIIEMSRILKQMSVSLGTEEFFYTLRPLLKNYEHGVTFEGIDNETIVYRGASGAQSSVLSAIDKLMDIDIAQQEVMLDMRNYMPPLNRDFLKRQTDNHVREYIQKSGDSKLVKGYNDIVHSISNFRTTHYEEIITPYIIENSSKVYASSILEKPGYTDCFKKEFIAKELLNLFLATKLFFVQNKDVEIDKNEVLLKIKQDLLNPPNTCDREFSELGKFEKEIATILTSITNNKGEQCAINDEQLLNTVLDTHIHFSLNAFGTAGMDFAHTLQHNILATQEYALPTGETL